ncbi:Do family serine endopeptidase [Candidatus Cardinium sp. cByotN1]|uniref:Do family serine endopeptidase n=1 Tax=Candidatus Cardinium sp. cByotN1 TaxID=2699439 RepID=UPI001FB4E610|nr:Do family serine endopeptidase [Candidatus Cardinium sp. cByotN1]
MYEQFKKQSVGRNLFSIIVLTLFGVWSCFRLPYILGEKQKPMLATVATQQVRLPSVEQHQPFEKLPLASEDKPLLTKLPDFTYAARVATPAVVHIHASQDPKLLKRHITPLEQLFQEFFGDRLVMPKEYQRPAQESVGSGVIYKSNGYIVTNNHVIEGADKIKVTLNNNRSYEAKLVGTDPRTDLALLKIEASGLPALVLGNSDKLEVGEWVLAVGNPFNLNSTVTQGIVSAKSRRLGECGNGKLDIQSFIQTDAVINQGNSGGALVNLYGELIGINTAIYASRSASFMGYGFAIPASLVKKVADDFIQYGAVQRALLGVIIGDVDAMLAEKLGLKVVSGVYIRGIQEHSPCAKLLQKEDVITQINGRKVNNYSDLQEIVACSQPGDKLTITLYRKGKEKMVNVLLEKAPDALQIVEQGNKLKVEGAVFQNLDPKTKAKFKLSGGVLVEEVTKGKFQAAGLKKGYILVAFDKKPVASIVELAEIIRRTTEPVLIQVIKPNEGGATGYIAIDLGSPTYHKEK